MGELVVGVDDSEGSRLALAWAADEAARRDAALVVVTVTQPPSWASTGIEGERERAEAFLRRLCAPLEARSLTVKKEVISGTPPARVLIDRARGSDGLLVGSRGRGGFTGLLLGSVSQQVSTHGPCPVTVVPADVGDRVNQDLVVRDHRGTVVVGVDGSAPARTALVRAAEEARLRDAVLKPVFVSGPPSLPPASLSTDVGRIVWAGTTPVRTPGPDPELQERREHAIVRWQSAAEEVLDSELRGLPDDQRPDRVEPVVVMGTHPAEALLDAAWHADLLVVGSRGRGGFAGLLLGSVSQQCVRHASVPVMVVATPQHATGSQRPIEED